MSLKISGAILAGGAGSRLSGMVKPRIIVEGQMIISRILTVIRDLVDEVIIATNSPEEFGEFTGCRIVGDEISKAGPLGGVHAALQNSSGDAVFVLAGDMPYLDRELIIRMIDVYANSPCQVLVPLFGGKIEPLHSVYNASLADTLNEFLLHGQQRAVRDFLSTVSVDYLELEDDERYRKVFTNINSPSDLSP
jgi:molybdopterin-guanine dinucleotide biosynthesis protein A